MFGHQIFPRPLRGPNPVPIALEACIHTTELSYLVHISPACTEDQKCKNGDFCCAQLVG